MVANRQMADDFGWSQEFDINWRPVFPLDGKRQLQPSEFVRPTKALRWQAIGLKTK
jgi:hypothetical protein